MAKDSNMDYQQPEISVDVQVSDSDESLSSLSTAAGEASSYDLSDQSDQRDDFEDDDGDEEDDSIVYEAIPEIIKSSDISSFQDLGITKDRRSFKRKALRLNKIFVGEVGEGYDIAQIYLYIVDISTGGMRITCDMDLPMDYVFHMDLTLDTPEPLNTDIKVIWKKELFGGTKLMGIQFINLPDSSKKVILDFMEKHSEEGKRRAFRLDRVLPVEIEIEGKIEKFNSLTMDLSTVGMKISNPFPLPFDKLIKLKLMLDFEDSPVYLKARTAWQNETSYGQYVIGIEFTHLRPEDKGRINLYIDRAISGELDQKIVKELPADLFNFPVQKKNKSQI